MSTTVYLISGASRGLGFALTKALVLRPDTVVFAGARSPATAASLIALSKEHSDTLHIVQLESESEEDAKAAAEKIQSVAGKVDVVIANAGVLGILATVLATPVEQFKSHFAVNTIGPIVLFQALHPLLAKSDTGAPKFILMSTAGASIGGMVPFPVAAYGASKAAANYVVAKMHAEHVKEGLVVLALHPGMVQTDSGNEVSQKFGMSEAPVTVADSVAGLLKVIDEAKLLENGPAFLDFTGATIPW